MKKSNIFWLLFTAAVLILSYVASQAQQQAPTYSVKAPLSDWQTVLAVVDQSNSSHATVEAVKKLIVDQIQAQLTAEGKAVQKADSLRKAEIKADSLKKVKK